MTIARVTAAIILVIMAATWGGISYHLLELQQLSPGLMAATGTLLSIVTGGEYVSRRFGK